MAKKGQLQPMALCDLTNISLYVLKLDLQAFWTAKDGSKGSRTWGAVQPTALTDPQLGMQMDCH